MILKNKKIIVIGGSGLIGSAIVKDLSSNGAKILVLDIKKPKKNTSVKNIKFINYDCSSKTFNQTFNKILENRFKPDVFINCSYPIISTKIYRIGNMKSPIFEALSIFIQKIYK